MIGAELMRAALAREPHGDQVPHWELEFQCWDAFGRSALVLGHAFEALSAAGQEDALRRNADIMVAVSLELGFSALTGPNGYWEQAPGELAYFVLPGDSRFRQMELLREAAPPELLLVGTATAIMGADYSEDFCFRLFEEPEEVDALAQSMLKEGLNQARRLIDAGAEAVVSPSDMADNAGPFFSPPQMERWVLPFLAEWSQGIRAMGAFSILHTDGNLDRILDSLANTGIHAIQAIDPVAGMSMVRAQEAVGDRICLCGNVDCGTLLLGSPEDVFDETTRLIGACRGRNGFVLGASNAVQPNVPKENYLALIEARRAAEPRTEGR